MAKHELALNCFENVCRMNRNHLDALFHVGIEFAQLDKHEKAVQIFDKVLERFGANVNVIYAKSRSKAALNQIDESFSLLREATKRSKIIKTWAREEKIFERFFDNPEFEKIIK